MNSKDIYIIIGASGDIGEVLAAEFSSVSPNLYLTYNNTKKPQSDNVTWHQVDVTSSDSVENFAKMIEQKLPASLKIIYCAGIVDDHPIPFISIESWSKVLDTNLTGAFLVIKNFFKMLSLNSNSKVVFIGSVASKKANIGQAAYSASKAGLEALCRTSALELGRFGVNCNVIAPGAIESAMVRNTPPEIVKNIVRTTPLRCLGTTADIVGVVKFLLSNESNHITGQTFYIDGGISII